VTPVAPSTFRAPAIRRDAEIHVQICALAKPNLLIGLPDAYTLEAGDGKHIGIAAVATMALSQQLRAQPAAGIKVEVVWNEEFHKYQITKLLADEVPVSGSSFFRSSK
jgi:hypothetical protein